MKARAKAAGARTPAAPAPLRLEPGRNCWRVERAERLRCVQDGADYFRLVREAILAAQHSVFILGWDIAGGIDLLPGAPEGGEPTHLAELLDFVARRRRELRCHVLVWDYAAFYAIERDPFSRVRLGLRTHRHVVFRFDDRHPFGASHHQKVIVVDDRLAFVSGIDLTHHRWDSSDHRVENPLRLNLMGKPYGPYHEVGLMLEGPAAAALGELARERWRRHGWRRRLPDLAPSREPGGPSPWPRDVEPDAQDVDVALLRTEPGFAGLPEVRECEALFVEAIRSARDSIYIENQYFTNEILARELAARLREPHGPEILVVGPLECEGWLERKTMGALRARVLAELQAADRHGHLRLCYPVASRAQDVCTFVHSKVMIVDDEHLRIGSANLSHRSMGYDTECDLALQAEGREPVRAAIRAVRARLLAEHLGATPEQVQAALAAEGSLHGALDVLRGGDRTLADYEVPKVDEDESLLQDAADPDAPLEVSQAVDGLSTAIEATEVRSRLLTWAPTAALLALALLLGWAELDGARWVTWSGLRELLALAPPSAPTFLAGLALFVLASLFFVPLELLVFVAVLVFSPGHGGALALLGASIGAALGYALGRALGSRRLLPWLGPGGRRLELRLRRPGFMTVAVLHVMAVATAQRIHLLAGAARLGLRDFAAGTLLGLAPMLLTLGVLAVLVRRLLLQPGPAIAVATAALVLALALGARRARALVIRRRFGPLLDEHRERDAYG